MARIFLSHSSQNNAEAIAVRDWLAGEGWDDVFLDLDPERGLKAGERWQEALKRASASCELVIFLISPDWASSRWCLAEFLLAKQINKRIFGVIIVPTPFESLPVEMTAEWQLVDLTAGPRTHEMTVTLPPGNATATVRFAEDGLNRLRVGLLNAGLDPKYFPWPPEEDPDRPPYRGLKPLEAEDAGIFFGRDGPTVEVLDRLRGLWDAAPPRMLVILGASGAGKSSFVRAGLLPRLARDSRHFRPLPVIRPNRAVITGETGLIVSLERALKAAGQRTTRADVRSTLKEGGGAVRALLAPLATGFDDTAKPPMLILPIDQGEELFLADGAEEAEAFLAFLRELLTADGPAVTTLVTIRSDNYEPMQTAPGLEGVTQQTYSLPPMPRGTFSQLIEGPARRLEGSERPLTIEGSLVDALLTDIEAGGAKDALPLLAFTLERLYREHGGDGDLKLSEYEALGRIRGSIEAAVEQALKAADASRDIPRDRAARIALLRRGLIPWLAGIDPESGAPQRRVALLSDIPAEARPLIELLVEQRLLATDVAADTGETTIEPAHEALLRQWGLLEDWLEEDFEDLSTAEGVKRAARDWDANARDPEWLAHAGGRLEMAEQVAAREDFAKLFAPGERAYLATARRAEDARRAAEAERERRQRELELQTARERAEASRRITRLSIVAAIVFAVLGGAAVWQWTDAVGARNDEEVAKTQAIKTLRAATAGRLAAEAQVARARFPQRAVLLAIEAIRATAEDDAYLPVAEQALRDALAQISGRPVSGMEDTPSVISRGPWQKGRNGYGSIESPDGRWRFENKFSRALLIDQTRESSIVIEWQNETGGPGQNFAVYRAQFSPDNRWLAAVVNDPEAGTGLIPHFYWIMLWDLRKPRHPPLTLRRHEASIEELALTEDWLISTSAARAILWDLSDDDEPKTVRLLGTTQGATALAVSNDQTKLAIGFRDHAVRVWALERLDETPVVLTGLEAPVVAVAFEASDGGVIATGGNGHTRRWGLTDGVQGLEPLILRGHTWPVRALAVTPDGNTLFSGGSGNDTETFIHRWTLAGSSVVTADTLAEEIHDLDVLQVSPGGRWLLSHGRYLDHARLHDLSTPGVGAYKIGFYPDFDVPPPFNGGVFSPDERWLILRTIPKDRPDGLFKLSGVSPKLVLGGNWRTHDKTDLLRATAFDATSHWMLARDKKDGLLLWDVSGEEPVPSVSDGRAIAAVSSDGRWFALGQKDGCVEVFSLKDPTTVATCVPTEYGPVDGIEVDADKSWLAIGRKTEKEGPFRWTLRKFSPSVGTDYDLGVLINLRFISEGVLVGWGEQAVIDLWKLGTDGVWQKFALRGHAAAIQHLAWTPDGRCLISGSDDTTLRLWDTEKPNQDPVVLRGHRGKISAMTLTPDGRRLISGDTLGEIRVWRLWTPDARPVERLTPLIQLSRDVVGRNLTGEERHGYQIGD